MLKMLSNFFIFLIFLIEIINCYEYETKYLDVKLDHFTYTNNNTFKLKYLINDKFWDRKNGPIFFYCGNEGAIEVFCDNTGFMWESAERFKALIVFAEHRYYGKSLPFGNKTFDSVENRGYLSALQALEDYVDVLEYIQSQANQAMDIADSHVGKVKKYPVIAFGGSYGGMLASWFRMKYPHIVQGALAASAPIWQFVNMAPCNTFNKIVTKVFKDTSQHCHDNIKKSWKLIDDIGKNDTGRTWLSKEWRLCTPLRTPSDIILFKNWINDMYGTMAMVNYPYPNDFLLPLPGHPIKKFCEKLDSSSNKLDLMKLFDGAQVYLNSTGKVKCLDWVPGTNVADLGLDGWNLQCCTEMVMPWCSTSEEMFEPFQWSFEDFKEACETALKVSPLEDIAEKFFGGYRIESASNIIFSNGLLDPWSGGGVLHNISDSVVAIIIPEGAHHLDLRSSDKEDPQSVIKARKYYEQTFEKWIKEFHNRENNKNNFYNYKLNEENANDISNYLDNKNDKSNKIDNNDIKKSKLGMFHTNLLRINKKK